MEQLETVVRLFVQEDGACEWTREHYALEDLGGTIPSVGDLIVDPGVPQGRDRMEPANRRIYEVTARYFRPRTPGTPYVMVRLLVTERRGRPEELGILGRVARAPIGHGWYRNRAAGCRLRGRAIFPESLGNDFQIQGINSATHNDPRWQERRPLQF